MDQALHFFFAGFQKGMLALDSRFLKASTFSVIRVGSDTFGDPIFQKDLQN